MKRLFLLLSVLSFAILASSYPPIPEKYWGYARLDGNIVNAGISITVKVTATGETVGSTLSKENGLYELDVVFDDITTNDTDEGADENDSLTWYIMSNECTAPSPGTDQANSGYMNSGNPTISFNITAESGGCEMPGDNPPCGDVTLAEVVDYITLWAADMATLADVVDLITAWAGG